MKNCRKKFKKLVAMISTACLLMAAIFVFNPESAEAAPSSVTWSVHAQPGYYQQQDVIAIVNHGNGYVATCTGITGDCSSVKTTITEYSDSLASKQVALDRIVSFTKTGASITFNAVSTPAGSTVYMKAYLTYSGGSTAGTSGTIRISN